MTQERVINIIERVCSGKATISIYGAISSQSVYCVLKVGNAETKIRISDHHKHNDDCRLRTLVWGKSTTKEHIERFMLNTIHKLKAKSTMMAIERIKKKDL